MIGVDLSRGGDETRFALYNPQTEELTMLSPSGQKPTVSPQTEDTLRKELTRLTEECAAHRSNALAALAQAYKAMNAENEAYQRLQSLRQDVARLTEGEAYVVTDGGGTLPDAKCPLNNGAYPMPPAAPMAPNNPFAQEKP